MIYENSRNNINDLKNFLAVDNILYEINDIYYDTTLYFNDIDKFIYFLTKYDYSYLIKNNFSVNIDNI